jgi:hypothetical protein
MTKIFEQTKTFFPEFKTYLKHDSAESCINHMIKEDKKGKVLAKFLELAANNSSWKKDSLAQKLVKKAVETVKADSSLKKAAKKLKDCKDKLKVKDSSDHKKPKEKEKTKEQEKTKAAKSESTKKPEKVSAKAVVQKEQQNPKPDTKSNEALVKIAQEALRQHDAELKQHVTDLLTPGGKAYTAACNQIEREFMEIQRSK